MDKLSNDTSGEEKLDKIIKKKTSENEALKELLNKLKNTMNSDEDETNKKQDKEKR